MLRLTEMVKIVLAGMVILILSFNTLSAQQNDPFIRTFSAQNVQERGVVLNWSSRYNDTTAFYIVERSLDGQNFEKLGEVTSINTQTSFKFIDRKPYSEVSYYRLQVIDYDGNAYTSNLVSLYIPSQGKPALVLYPMPVGNANTLNLNFQGIQKNTKAIITITDHFGRQVLSKEIDVNSLNSHNEIELNGLLSPGNYQMTVLGHSGQSFKIGKLLQIVK